MAAAFRSLTSTTYASRTNTVLTAPAGLANNDILIAAVFVGASGGAPAVTAPAGFTALSGSPTIVSGGGFEGRLNVFWKRAASESGSYTFTHSSASSQGVLQAISGCIASGSPVDASSNNIGDGSTSTALAVTTTAADDLLLFIEHDWEGTGTLSPPSGFTERFDGLIYAADAAQASAGASGNKTQTNGNLSAFPWAAWLVALKGAAGSSAISASAAQAVAVGQSAGSTVLVKGAAAQVIAVGQVAAAAVIVKASASQTIDLSQSASGQMVLVKAQASQTIGIGQSASAASRVAASAAQSISVGQSASAAAIVAASSVSTVPVSQNEPARSRLRPLRPRSSASVRRRPAMSARRLRSAHRPASRSALAKARPRPSGSRRRRFNGSDNVGRNDGRFHALHRCRRRRAAHGAGAVGSGDL